MNFYSPNHSFRQRTFIEACSDLMKGELLIDIGTSEYGLVKDEYRLGHSTNQNDAVGIGQFRVGAKATSILLNIVFLNGKLDDGNGFMAF